MVIPPQCQSDAILSTALCCPWRFMITHMRSVYSLHNKLCPLLTHAAPNEATKIWMIITVAKNENAALVPQTFVIIHVFSTDIFVVNFNSSRWEKIKNAMPTLCPECIFILRQLLKVLTHAVRIMYAKFPICSIYCAQRLFIYEIIRSTSMKLRILFANRIFLCIN